jgi:ABC-type Na+ efflux pump permease subunit
MLHKIFLVTQREFITRVRKKSFIVMTLAAPLLIVLFYGLIFYFAINKDIGASKKKIYVSDQGGNYVGKLKNSETLEFTFGYVVQEKEQQFLTDEDYYALLVIPNTSPDSLKKVTLYTKDQAGLSTVLYIEKQLENEEEEEENDDDKNEKELSEEELDKRIAEVLDQYSPILEGVEVKELKEEVKQKQKDVRLNKTQQPPKKDKILVDYSLSSSSSSSSSEKSPSESDESHSH